MFGAQNVWSTEDHSVTICVATTRWHLYVADSENAEYYGEWPGTQMPNVTITKDEVTYYKEVLTIPDGKTIRIAFTDGQSGIGTHQTPDILVGTIKKDTTLFYNFNGSFYTWGIIGINGDWTNNRLKYYCIGSGSEVSVPLAASTDKWFRVYNTDGDGKQYGLNQTISSSVPNHWFYGSDGNACKLVTGAEGCYVFSIIGWHDESTNDKGPIMKITYPNATPYTRSGLAAGAWGTICLEGVSDASFYPNAKFNSIDYKNVNGSGEPTSIVLVEETGQLVAGRPYIFKVTSAGNLSLPYTGSVEAGSYRGLVGAINAISVSDMTTLIGTTNVYLLTNVDGVGCIRKAATGSQLGANKAYIDMDNVPTTPIAGAPGARFEIPLAPNNATSIQDIEANDIAVKFIENGKFFIQKNGVVYDATGRVAR